MNPWLDFFFLFFLIIYFDFVSFSFFFSFSPSTEVKISEHEIVAVFLEIMTTFALDYSRDGVVCPDRNSTAGIVIWKGCGGELV